MWTIRRRVGSQRPITHLMSLRLWKESTLQRTTQQLPHRTNPYLNRIRQWQQCKAVTVNSFKVINNSNSTVSLTKLTMKSVKT